MADTIESLRRKLEAALAATDVVDAYDASLPILAALPALLAVAEAAEPFAVCTCGGIDACPGCRIRTSLASLTRNDEASRG